MLITKRFRHPNEIPVTSPAVFPAVVPRGNKDAIMSSIADSYMSQKDQQQHKKYKKFKKTSRKYRKWVTWQFFTDWKCAVLLG